MVNLDCLPVPCPTSHQILMLLSSKENLITSYYLHCFSLRPHFLPRLPKQHPKCSSCLCPSIIILKSSARVMLLKTYVRSCHSSVQNPPTPLHLSAKVKGPWLQGLYNLHRTQSLPCTSLTMHLCTFASAHFSSLTNILMFCDFIRPTLTPEPLQLLFPVYFQRAAWLAPSPTFRSLYTWYLLSEVFPDQPI